MDIRSLPYGICLHLMLYADPGISKGLSCTKIERQFHFNWVNPNDCAPALGLHFSPWLPNSCFALGSQMDSESRKFPGNLQTPSRGFAANIGAATTIVVASRMGFPISTTHTLVGAVLGIGLARGIDYLNLRVVRDIAVSWIVTIPAGGGLAALFYFILKAIFVRG